MQTMLVWILISMHTGLPVQDYRFPTQTDCIRAGTVFAQYSKNHDSFRCEKLTIVAPTVPSNSSLRERLQGDGQSSQPKDTDQLHRNASYNWKKLNEISQPYAH